MRISDLYAPSSPVAAPSPQIRREPAGLGSMLQQILMAGMPYMTGEFARPATWSKGYPDYVSAMGMEEIGKQPVNLPGYGGWLQPGPVSFVNHPEPVSANQGRIGVVGRLQIGPTALDQLLP